jgi:hypothetical protein
MLVSAAVLDDRSAASFTMPLLPSQHPSILGSSSSGCRYDIASLDAK